MNVTITVLNVLVVLVGIGCAITALAKRSPVLGTIGFGLFVLEQLLIAAESLVGPLAGANIVNAFDALASLVGIAGLAVLYVGLFARPAREAPAPGPGWGGPAYGPQGPPPPGHTGP
ncbi:MAG TPA: hypothetical protein VGL93_34965 [Streptosporangiaceae bacterium]